MNVPARPGRPCSCKGSVACVEVVARLKAADKAYELGLDDHPAAAALRAQARRFAELHRAGPAAHPTRFARLSQ